MALKITIQQLHVAIVDYLDRACNIDMHEGLPHEGEATRNLISEMEKALNVAAQTVNRLESDLDKEKFRTS